MRPQPRQTFRELLAQTRDSAVGAFAHSRVDLEWLVRDSNPDRRHGAERMTRVSFGLREPDGGGFCPPGVQCERAELRGHFSQLPLSLMVELAGREVSRRRAGRGRVSGRGAGSPRWWSNCCGTIAVLLDNALADPDTTLSAVRADERRRRRVAAAGVVG